MEICDILEIIYKENCGSKSYVILAKKPRVSLREKSSRGQFIYALILLC